MAHRWSLTGNSAGGGAGGGTASGSASKECGDEFEIAVLLDRSDSRSSAAPRIIARGNQRRTVSDGGQRQHNDRTSGVDDGRDSDDEERIMILDEQQHQQLPSQSKRCKRNGNAKGESK